MNQATFLEAAAQLSDIEKDECAARAQIQHNELFRLTQERLRGAELPADPDAKQKVIARAMFEVMADRYREEVVATVRAKASANG